MVSFAPGAMDKSLTLPLKPNLTVFGANRCNSGGQLASFVRKEWMGERLSFKICFLGC